MRLRIFISGRRVAGTVCIICLALDSAALLGVGWKGGSLYHSFLIFPSHLASSHKWGCLFLKGAFLTPWPLVRILRILIRSWGFPSNHLCSNVLEDSEVVGKIDLNLRGSWGFLRTIVSALSTIVIGLEATQPLAWWISYRIIVP